METFRKIFLHDWQYKIVALLIGFSLWFIVNIGVRAPLIVERNIKIINDNSNYIYRLDRKRARIKLLVIERLSIDEFLEDVQATVDVRGLGEGDYVLKVNVGTPFKFLVYPVEVEPQSVKVYIRKKLPQGQ
ncbi:MAG: hypothetical protein ACK4SM_02280 [Aquificaceae bacterium]